MAKESEDKSYLYNVDKEKVTALMADTQTNVEYFNNAVKDTVKAYSEALDNLMADLYEDCVKKKNPSDELLENYFLELTNMLYFMEEKVEALGVYADMSKAAAKEVYNKAYLDNQVKDEIDKKNKTTVAENTAVAENKSQYETVVGAIYDHAYKIVKNKVDAGYEMVGTLRKIISRRMAETQLSFGTNSSLPRNQARQAFSNDEE
jgi:Glu-tRNA(Gln) amidotransferase subunit E-like FAD-binding protein